MSNYYDIVREEIMPFLPSGFCNVMEIGCGSGNTLKHIKDKYSNIETIGVEINSTIARIAHNNVDYIYNEDAENADYVFKKYSKKIDVLLLLDIVEHLRDPWGFLINCREMLSEDGVIISSIPNIRNLKVLLPLVFLGKWDYQSAGILDITHLRFFTFKTIVDMVNKCDMKVVDVRRTGPLEFSMLKSKAGYVLYFVNLLSLGCMKEFITHQYILKIIRD